MKKSSRLQSQYLIKIRAFGFIKKKRILSPSEWVGKGGELGMRAFLNQSINLPIVQCGDARRSRAVPGLLSLFVPLQWWVSPEPVVTLWPQVETGPSKIVRVLPSMRRLTVVSVVQQLSQPTILGSQ